MGAIPNWPVAGFYQLLLTQHKARFGTEGDHINWKEKVREKANNEFESIRESVKNLQFDYQLPIDMGVFTSKPVQKDRG